jgi:hypothetical protein
LIFCNFSTVPELPKKKKKIQLMTLEGNALENNISPENHPSLSEIDIPQKFLDISLYNAHQSDSVLMIPSNSNNKKNSVQTNNHVYLQIDKIADVSWSEMKVKFFFSLDFFFYLFSFFFYFVLGIQKFTRRFNFDS